MNYFCSDGCRDRFLRDAEKHWAHPEEDAPESVSDHPADGRPVKTP
jgi:hypothetical protein